MDEVGALVEHPLVAGVAAVRAGLAQALTCPPAGLRDGETVHLLASVLELGSMLTALTGAVVTDVVDRGIALRDDYPSTEAFLAARLRLTRSQANALVRDSHALAEQPVAAELLAHGEANPVQALSIAQTLGRIDRLPLVSPEERAWAKTFLRAQAGLLDALQLARAGCDLVEKLTRTPDVDDPAEAARLEREADRAYRQRAGVLTLKPDGSGRAWFQLDAPGMATLLAGLEPLAQPLPEDDGVKDSRSRGQRLADALIELVSHALDQGTLPEVGGERPHVAMTLDYHRLTESLSGLLVDTGAVLAPSEARRLACDAGIFPMVLSGTSLVLDIGRASRQWPAGTRRAIVARDRGCVFPGCDRPPSLTRVHHRRHWGAGGPTNVDNGALLCEHHHRVVHRHGWAVILHTNGLPALVPPCGIDPDQRPRLHHRFRLRELGPPG